MKGNGMDAISVIIPTYNRARFIDRAIRSALAAVSEGDEIIIVDDGSTDDTASVVEPWLDRVRYVRIENRGAGGARNHGISLASKPLIAFLDSDDEWFADKLALQRPFMAANPDIVFCFTDFAFHNDDTGVQERMYLRHWHSLDEGWEGNVAPGFKYSSRFELPKSRDDFTVHIGDFYTVQLDALLVAAWTTVVRRELAGEALHFTEGIKICEDWWCYANLARRGPVAFFKCETAWNHGHTGLRVTDASKYDFLTCRLQMTENVWGADEQFRTQHGRRYSHAVRHIHHERAKWLISRGKMREARADLTRAGAGMAMRILASLPGPVALLLGELRRLTMQVRHLGLLTLPLVTAFLQDSLAPALMA